MAPTILETDVLRARDPALDDTTDEWPEFQLSSVHVRLPDDPNTAVSLLEAAQHFPVTVVGQLEPLDSKLAHLYIASSSRKRVTIVIEDVRFFSYGQYPDGSIAIWAPGKAGWFALKPGRSYKQIYAQMIEAVEAFYFIVDAYREPRKRKRSKVSDAAPCQDIDDFFTKYAAEAMHPDATLDEAREHVYAHKDALLSFMVAGKEDVVWSKNPLYTHLSQKFSAAHSTITKNIKGTTTCAKASSLSPSVDMRTEGVSRTTRNTRSVVSKALPASSNADESSGADASKADRSRRRGRPRNTPSFQSIGSVTSDVGDGPSTPLRESDSDAEVPQRQGKSILRLRASKTHRGATRVGGKAPPRFAPASDGEQDSGDLNPLSAGAEDDSDRSLIIDSGGANPTERGDIASSGDARQHQANDPVQEDTWVCALDGCRYKIYDASRAESQKLIKEHYELHAFDDDDRVQLIKRLQEPSLPAGHLMERVKMQAKMDGYPGSKYAGTRYPDSSSRVGVIQKY